jgi:hypothetical protein
MTILMPATPNFTTCRFGLETNTQTFTSPLTKNVQRILLGGARWTANYSLPAMNRNQAGPWKAFFDLCEGQANVFQAFDPDNKLPRGFVTGSTPLVNGASQTGSSLTTDGWVASKIVLKAGDYFTVNSELKRITADVVSDGSGNATIPFKPALRGSPADNAALTVTNATTSMTLQDDMQAMFTCDKNGIYQPLSFAAFEVF